MNTTTGLAGMILSMAAGGAWAQSPRVPPPADVAYPGTIRLEVDATDIQRHIFRVHEEIPVAPGKLTLLYPAWLPGKHAPRGPIDKLAGLVTSANGHRLEWQRDPLDVYAFHLDIPQGVDTLSVDFQYLSPQEPAQGRVVMTPDMLNLQWDAVALYPAGHAARRITFAPSVKLPGGWHYAGALDLPAGATPNEPASDGVARFKPVDFETLVDSPLFAGRHFKRIELAGNAPVHLNLFADAARFLAATPAQLKLHENLVVQARKLFGSQHYDHYDFLLALTNQLGGIGLEHSRSSENSGDPGYFTEWDKHAPGRGLLPHEFTHSWNGKFRRPVGSATANYNVPMDDGLLWVYEGQTQYWGFVLAARSGLWSSEQTRDALALVAATYADNRPGFAWRNVQDTTQDPIIAARRALPYRNWQMSEDYYSAGQLIWLAVDAKLRELTGDKRSLDDFARAFFGIDDGSWAISTYDFDDVVAALDGVAHHDWARFLRERIDGHAPPLDGLAASGWKLVYRDKPSAFEKANQGGRRGWDYSASLGFVVGGKDGRISDVCWDGAAFNAGVTPTSTIVAVNGRAWSNDELDDAITAAVGSTAPIELLLKDGNLYRSVRLDYHGGLRFPHLERIEGSADRLSAILAPR
ncbi:MAG: M61 family metallopeptidase [Dokdonella sp.]|uniref:M61 family metallopeptidase n=1 Tax=Dokdonella sp. TaxID=2291710 RepID=UPI0025BC2418|nr:peptidase M61 [Dokdonella sp.]MBX3700015.1 M61 family metallopeptidase [Dokdonella sp.]